MAKPKKNDLREWDKVRKRVQKLGNVDIQIGIIGSKGGDQDRGGITLVEIAAIHEFGAPNAGIPERSFIRRTFELKKDVLEKFMSQLVAKALEGKLTPEKVAEALGMWGAVEVKKTINDQQVTPRLSESAAGQKTIARKGSSVTLVDDGVLVNSINYEVKKKR